ncbi:MAG: RluA family pseudouridine synthase [Eubacteriales bacterium]|nr:RluA family pseudouridine synthase [Eubacteriales bacterium]
MKEIIVREQEACQRLDKLLGRYLAKAPKNFLYKMLRKKNITLNGKKALGNEMVAPGDRIQIFFSEETYAKFSGSPKDVSLSRAKPFHQSRIIYEDRHILLADKPAGLLSQKSRPEDISANEQILAYLLQKNELNEQELSTFRPSVCNRLDRNTSGLLIAGKSLAGLQKMAELLRSRELHKYYLCLVDGEMKEPQRLEGYLKKEDADNRVSIVKSLPEGQEAELYRPILTEYTPLWSGKGITLLKVWLITGRSHQIRAHLASVGHPIIGDTKYGNARINDEFLKAYGVKHQLLHAYQMVFPKMDGQWSYLSGRVFTAPMPKQFAEILGSLGYGGK